MNILLINHYAGSPQHGMEFRPYYLAREWVKAGNNVRILAGSYSHIRAKQPLGNKGRHHTQQIDGIDYCWYRTPSYRGNGIGRVKSMLYFMGSLWSDAKAIANDFKPDVVIASSTYPMDIWPAERIAKLARARLVYEVHDLWPLSPMELGGMSRWHPFIMWVQWAEDYAYKKAQLVVSMLPKTLEYMVARGMSPDKWAYVPNGVDLKEWRIRAALPTETSAALEAVKARGLPVLCYAGTHGLANALDVLLDASVLLKGQVEVVLVGTGPERDRLLQRVEDEGMDNVTMLPSVPKACMPALLAEIDIAFIGLLPEPLFRFGISPNKLFDYMMAGKPIVQSISAGNDPVTEVGCGISVPPDQPSAISDAALKIAAMSAAQRDEMGKKGVAFIQAERSYTVLAEKFLQAVQALECI